MEDDKLRETINENKILIDILSNKYLQIAKKVGLDKNDLYNEALIGLNNALITYDDKKNASFKTYSKIVIENQLKDYIKTNSKNNNVFLNESFSLDNNETRSIFESYSDKNLIVDNDLSYNELNKEILLSLSDIEKKVYELKKEGKSNKEISFILNVNRKSIENTLERIKSKIKKIIK